MSEELKFMNSDATPKTVVVYVAFDSVEPIMSWYGSHHAGDRYVVFLNGVELKKDKNGEWTRE